jgi:glycosyltransferase involved in cell wall biosynthesis
MKAIIDISLLGQGFYHPNSRTGIFRVVESLAQLMPKLSPDLEILFAENIDLLASIGYSEQHFFNSDFPYINSEKEINSRKIQNALLLKFSHNSLIQKSLRKVFAQFNHDSFLLREDLLSHSNIYHSPYYPIPQQIKEHKHIKQIITIHDLIPIKFPQYFQHNLNSDVHKIVASISKDTHVICISESTKNDLLEITKLPDEQVSVVNLAASEKLFYPVDDVVLKHTVLDKYKINTPFFLSVATLEPRKNLQTLIKCFSRMDLQEKNKDLSLVLVGTKGWEFEKLLNESKVNIELSKRIIFTEYVPDEDLAALYSSALGFVYLSHYEGFGLPPLEAMQCGTPVICSNTSSLPEVVGDGGILISPTDEDGICNAMLDVIANQELRTELSLRATGQAKQFSWNKFSEETWKVYQKIT